LWRLARRKSRFIHRLPFAHSAEISHPLHF
jgi:hypothetical protein